MEEHRQVISAANPKPAAKNSTWLPNENDQKIKAKKEPSLDIPAKNVNLSLVFKEEDANCIFWVGLSKKGQNNPNDLLEISGIYNLLNKVCSEGITEDEPIMLSDANSSASRYIYLLPPPTQDQKKSENHKNWLNELISTVNSWSSANVGFYFAPELMGAEKTRLLLKEILEELIPCSSDKEYYVLVGDHGLNAMLNTSHALRAELTKRNVDLSVYH